MSETIFLPKWGMTMSEGTVVNWLKQEGDAVEQGEGLVEVETDKVVNTLESPVSGLLESILVPEGETVEVGTELAIINPGE